MPRATRAAEGAAYLPDYKIGDLECMLESLPDGKPRMLVYAAILRKEGRTCKNIAEILRKKHSTIHDWLVRMADGGMCRIYDRPGTGHPCKLADDEKNLLELFICNGPRACGYERDTWTSDLLARQVERCFGQTYGRSGMLRMVSGMGYSVRSTRPVPYNSASPAEQAEFREATQEDQMEHRKKGYKILCFDACAKTDSPLARRGIRRRGGSDTVSTNYSKKSIQMLGILGEDTLDIMFSETYKSDDTIQMLKHACKKYGKIYCALDNAGANKSADVAKHVAESNGDIVLRYTLPHTPQLNPIEPQWSAIKGGISGTYYGDFESMQQSIRDALYNGEIPVVRLQEYLSDPEFERKDVRVEVICTA